MYVADRISVLLVDDRPENLMALEVLLDDMGLDLVKSASGNEALSLTLKEEFALVIMDVQMPEMDGFEVAELMRSNLRTRHIPIIFVTAGMNDIRSQFKGYGLGAVDYLVKPIEPLFLRSKVRVFCDLYRQRQEIDYYGRNLQLLVHKQTNELRTANETLQKLSYAVEQSPVAIVITDTNGDIEFVNQKFIQLTGYTAEDAIGQNPRIMQSEKTLPEVYKKLWETVTAGNVWEGEFCNKKKNGTLFWEHATISPIKDADGTITHYMAFKEDITGRRALEGQLRHAQKMEAVGTLAGGVAHDFNNILTVIMGYAGLIKVNDDADGQMALLAQEIISSVDRAAELTKSLLAFSRKQETKTRPVDLNDLIRGLHSTLKRLIREDIDLKVEAAVTDLVAQADNGQLEQMIINLTVNARDAMPSGGELLIKTEEIHIEEGDLSSGKRIDPGRYGLITVSDSGIGMDRHIQERIFEPFFTTKDIGKGTGLGLSMAFGVIKEHNGYIIATSEPGQGAIFRVYLPLLEVKVKPQEILKEKDEQHLDEGIETILLVEDDRAIREMTERFLTMKGYNVLVAENGAQAVELFRKNHDSIQLLLSDIIMPKMNGRQMYEEIGAIKPDLPAIFMSGYSADIMIDNAFPLEKVQFLAKPMKPAVLLCMIQETLMAQKCSQIPESTRPL